jgi:hypothetical protein
LDFTSQSQGPLRVTAYAIVYAFTACFCEPHFERFGPFAGYGLDKAEDLLAAGYISQVFFAIRGF